MPKFEGADLARIITDSLNSFAHDDTIADCVDTLSREHRTLQQTFTKLCVAWFRRLAEDPGCFDLRNEASVRLACAVLRLGEDKLALPFI